VSDLPPLVISKQIFTLSVDVSAIISSNLISEEGGGEESLTIVGVVGNLEGTVKIVIVIKLNNWYLDKDKQHYGLELLHESVIYPI
jgi:hypothetical protein